jgi:hypothetical protein
MVFGDMARLLSKFREEQRRLRQPVPISAEIANSAARKQQPCAFVMNVRDRFHVTLDGAKFNGTSDVSAK